MKKRYQGFLLLAIIAIIALSCEPRIDFDDGQWGIHADITSGAYFFVWTTEDIQLNDMVTGTKKTSVTESSTVDLDALKNTVKIKADYDISKMAMYIYHNGSNIEPLNGAPTPGVISDYSAKKYVYRIHSTNGEYKDWTIIIEQ
jgi:hypothetical protein